MPKLSRVRSFRTLILILLLTLISGQAAAAMQRATSLELSLIQATGTINGIIRDGNGVAVPNIYLGAQEIPSGEYVSGQNNADGTYTLTVPSGNYCITAFQAYAPFASTTYGGSCDAPNIVEVSSGENVTGIDLQFDIPLPGAIHGYVYDAGSGYELRDYDIQIYRVDEAGSVISEVGAEGIYGEYIFQDLPLGLYKVWASRDEFIPEFYEDQLTFENAQIIEITPNAAPLINFFLQRGATVNGTVYEADHVTPLANAEVTFYEYNYAGGYEGTHGPVITDANGSFSYLLPINLYKASASADGYYTEFYSGKPNIATSDTFEVRTSDDVNNINFSLDLPGTISGTVTEGDGVTPIANAEVSFYPPDYVGSYAGSIDAILTDEDGNYSIELPPGVYRTGATAAGYAGEFYEEQSSAWFATSITLSSEQAITDIDFTLTDTAILTGTIHLIGHGTPPNPQWAIPLDVMITPQAGGAPVFDGTVVSNQSGVFTITDIEPGNYVIRVKSADALAVTQIATLVIGNNTITFPTLKSGDANGDNRITIPDFSILASTFGRVAGDPGYDARADFNGDGRVTIPDFSLLASNFGQTGDS